MHHCPGAWDDSKMVGTPVCPAPPGNGLSAPQEKPLLKRTDCSVWDTEPAAITFCYVLLRSKDICFRKGRHGSMNQEHRLSVFTDSVWRHKMHHRRDVYNLKRVFIMVLVLVG